MRILILLPNDSMGGAEQYLKMVASYFTGSTVDVFFLQTFGQTSWGKSQQHIKLHYPKNNNKVLSIINFIFSPIHQKEKKYDYIFTSHVYTTGLVGILLRLNLIGTSKFVARESTSIFMRFKGIKLLSYKLFYWLGYKKVDLLICQTDFMKNQLLEGFPKLAESTNITVIPNPIDFSIISESENNPLKEKLPPMYIVSAGRLIPEKGYDILINAFSLLKPDYPRLKLIILGEGILKGELLAQAIQLNLEKDIIFRGFVENVYPFFKYAEACVVSSRIEGFPNVLLQMMSQNSQVVSTTCAGGINEIPGIHISEPDHTDSLKLAIDSALRSKANNRILFNDFLKNRDISSFINHVNNSLKNE